MICSRFSLKKYRIYLAFTLCAGVAMIFIANQTGEVRKNDEEKILCDEKAVDNLPQENIEVKLEQILCEMSGAGRIEVMISYESTDEKLVLKDKKVEFSFS